MEIREYVQIIRHWWWLIALGAILAGAAAYFASSAQQPVYRATSTLLVREASTGPDIEMSALQVSERLAQSYVERLKNYEVLQTAIDNVGLNMEPRDLEEQLQVRLLGQTQLIELGVEHRDPVVAQALANEIPTVFAERNSRQQLERFAKSKTSLQAELGRLQEELETAEEALAQAEEEEAPSFEIEELRNNVLRLRDTHSQLLRSYEDIRVAEASSLSNVIIDEPARLPQQPVAPRPLTNTALATMVGGMAALGLVFLRDYMDNTVRNPAEVERATGLSTLGAIARLEVDSRQEAVVTAHAPRSPVAEAYRQLRTNLMFSLLGGDLSSILVTSPGAGEGKTTTAANVAVVLAQAGKRVILVDADLRRPTVHRLFSLGNSQGLSTLFMQTPTDASVLRETDVKGLHVLTSGPLPPNPAELLGAKRMQQIMAWLQKQADYVVLDSPPLLAVTDAAVLSRLADSTLLVLHAGQTALPALTTAVEQLQTVEARISGAVLNRISPKDGYYYYYYYRDRYYDAETVGENGYSRAALNGERKWPTLAGRL